jgi:hypothetical protein
MDALHFLSAGVVSFARGPNDTPKIAALLLVIRAMDIRFGMAALAIAMAIGGLLNAAKVAETISLKITSMNHGQGFGANLATGVLVILASVWGTAGFHNTRCGRRPVWNRPQQAAGEHPNGPGDSALVAAHAALWRACWRTHMVAGRAGLR